MLETRTGQFTKRKPIMHSLSIVGNQPKIFGFLYIAVFSNGTVKAGRSTKDPHGRVTAHANSGKAFDVHLDSAFYASVYTNDTCARERLMHQEIGLLARLTSGREWFKFVEADAAVNFASSYLDKVERMSFAERPSVEQLIAQQKTLQEAFGSRGILLFDWLSAGQADMRAFVAPDEAELEGLEKMLSGHSLDVVIKLARMFTDFEDFLAQKNDGFDSGLSVLVEAMNRGWDEALAELDDPDDFQGRCRALESMSFEAAVRVIKASSNYPNFFREALSVKWEAA